MRDAITDLMEQAYDLAALADGVHALAERYTDCQESQTSDDIVHIERLARISRTAAYRLVQDIEKYGVERNGPRKTSGGHHA